MLNRRGLLILGGAATSLTLIGNQQVLALVPETDRFHRAAAGAQHLISALPPEFHAYVAYARSAPPLREINSHTPEAIAAIIAGTYDRRRFEDPERLAAVERHEKAGEHIRAAYQAFLAGGSESPYGRWLIQAGNYLHEVMNAFPEQPDPAMVQDLFDERISLDILNDADLRVAVPSIIPIAITRSLVQKHHAPFHMSRMPFFMAYADRYRSVVMADDPETPNA